MIRAVPALHAWVTRTISAGRGASYILPGTILALAIVAGLVAGCAIVPRSRMDECQRSHADATLRERADERPCPCAARARTETTPNAPSTMPSAWQFKTKRSNGSNTACRPTRTNAHGWKRLISNWHRAWLPATSRPSGRPRPSGATAAPSDEPQPPATARVSQTPRRESDVAPPR